MSPLRLLALLALLLTASCGSGAGGEEGAERTTLTVLAAASLTNAAAEITTVYQGEHPDVRLRFSLAGSQELASQVRQGVPADVLVTADAPTMDGLGDLVGDEVLVASNELSIVVAATNPEGIEALDDLARPDVITVLAAPNVPAGRYARAVLDSAGVQVKARSEEPDVRAVLTRVRLGEADAGIVYVTDIAAGGDEVEAVPIPADVNVVARYPAAVLADTKQAEAAAELVDWLAAPAGLDVLTSFGFQRP